MRRVLIALVAGAALLLVTVLFVDRAEAAPRWRHHCGVISCTWYLSREETKGLANNAAAIGGAVGAAGIACSGVPGAAGWLCRFAVVGSGAAFVNTVNNAVRLERCFTVRVPVTPALLVVSPVRLGHSDSAKHCPRRGENPAANGGGGGSW